MCNLPRIVSNPPSPTVTNSIIHRELQRKSAASYSSEIYKLWPLNLTNSLTNSPLQLPHSQSLTSTTPPTRTHHKLIQHIPTNSCTLTKSSNPYSPPTLSPTFSQTLSPTLSPTHAHSPAPPTHTHHQLSHPEATANSLTNSLTNSTLSGHSQLTVSGNQKWTSWKSNVGPIGLLPIQKY